LKVLELKSHSKKPINEREIMNINKTRGTLYRLAKLLGDISAVSSTKPAKITKRITRRVTGKATGKLLGKLFK